MRRLLVAGLLLCAAAPAPARIVAGQLLTPEGTPAAGASVSVVAVPLLPASPWPPGIAPPSVIATATTTETGGFTIEGELPPFAALRVEGAGLASLTLTGIRLAPEGPLPLDLELTSALMPVRVDGVVLDPAGRPAPGVSLGVLARTLDGAESRRVVSGPDGRFVLESLPGIATLNVLAMREDGAIGRASAILEESGTQRVVVALEEPVPLQGAIVTAASQGWSPAAGASVVVHDPVRGNVPDGWGAGWDLGSFGIATTTTDAEGRWRATGTRSSVVTLASAGLLMADLAASRSPAQRAAPVTGAVLAPDGRPLAGAVVDAWGSGIVLAITDEAGRFTLPRPATETRLAVRAPGLLGARSYPVPRPGTSARLRLPRGERSGTVLLPPAEDGTPGAAVPGALVILRIADGTRIVAATDEAGRFRVSGIPPGACEISARARGLVGTLDARLRGPIVLGPAARLPVRVFDGDREGGKQLPGVLLVAAPATGAEIVRRVRSGPAGTVTIDSIVPGAWQVRAFAPAARSATGEGRASAGATAPVEIAVPATGALAVSCVDSSGAPVPDAQVVTSVNRWGGKSTSQHVIISPGITIGSAGALLPPGAGARIAGWTGPDGRARLEGLPPGCVSWAVVRAGYAPEAPQACVPVGAGATAEARAVLRASASLRVNVADADGLPVAGALVVLSSGASAQATDAARGMDIPSAGRPATGPDGAAVLTGLRPGRMLVRAGARGRLASPKVPVDIGEGAMSSVDLVLGSAATLTGRVVDATGRPAPDATVKVEVDEESQDAYMYPMMPVAVMAETGRFVVEGLLPDAPVTIAASRAGDASPPRRARPGDDVTLELVARASVAGSVLRDGEGVGGAQVTCGGQRATSGDDGSFEVRGLAPGTVTCTATADAGVGRAADVAAVAGTTTPVTIVLHEPREISITVIDATTGAAIAAANVQGPVGTSLRTDEEGIARMKLAPWETTSARAGWIWASGYDGAPFSLPESGDAVTVRLTKRAQVTGRVTCADCAVAGTTVNGTNVKEDGSFEVPSPGAGVMQLYALKVEGATRREASLQVEVPEDSVLSGLVLPLQRVETCTVRVRVVQGDAPVPHAPVRLVPDTMGGSAARWGQTNMFHSYGSTRSSQANGTTEADGVFTAEGLPPGSYSILTGESGGTYLGYAGSVRLAGSEVTEVTVSLPAGVVVTGRVLRAGAPVEAANLQLAAGGELAFWSSNATRTESDGSFRVGPIPRAMRMATLIALAPQPSRPGDVGRMSKAVTLDGDPEPVLFDIAGASIAGDVLAEGEPVADALVSARLQDDAASRNFQSVVTARTRADGTFTIDGIAPGMTADVTASLAGWDSATQRIVVAPGVARLTLRLGQAGGIRGVATTPEGPLRTGLSLRLIRDDGALVQPPAVVPEPDGSFAVRVEPDRPHRYLATSASWAPLRGTIEPGDALILAFTRGARIDLVATRADGEPVEGASVRLLSLDGVAPDDFLVSSSLVTNWNAGSTDASGRLALSGLAPGTYVVEVLQGDRRGEGTVTLAPDGRAPLAVIVD